MTPQILNVEEVLFLQFGFLKLYYTIYSNDWLY